MATYLCTDDVFLGHRPLGEHPERPERLARILAAIESSELRGRLRRLPIRPATNAELARVHSDEYLWSLEKRMGPGQKTASGWLDPDTYFGPGSWDAVLRAAGCAVDLSLKLLEGTSDNGFALVRPPGHHATRDRAMGFCLINNVAVAAAAARAQGARVSIVDWDVHHGNGTADIFATDRNVQLISTHQFPFYPGTGLTAETGTGLAAGSKINIPLPQGAAGTDYLLAFRKIVLPALRRFSPDLVLVSAGFDAHARDPLAGMSLVEADYAELTHLLLSVQPRLGLVLEGGYHLDALASSVLAVLRVLIDPAGFVPGDQNVGREVLLDTRTVLSDVARVHNL